MPADLDEEDPLRAVQGRCVLFHTTYSEYFNEEIYMFDALDFFCRAHPTNPAEASAADSPLWVVRIPYKRVLGAHALGRRASAGP